MSDALKALVYEQARYSSTPQIRTICPACGPDRKLINRREETLSITVSGDKATFFCHHCSVKGAVTLKDSPNPLPRIQAAVQPKPLVGQLTEISDLSEAAVSFLASRGLSAGAAKICGVRSAKQWFRKLGRDGEALVFPYTNKKVPYAFKYRCLEGKDFSCNGAPNTFFNAEAHTGDVLVIVEGELDVVAMTEAGIAGVVSVPGGAINRLIDRSTGNDADGGKMGFLWNSRELLDKCVKIILATDNDGPGQTLAEEIARRVGKGKCFIATFPDDTKDANDVLVKHGAEALKRLIAEAKPVPVAGLHTASEFQVHLSDLYDNGLKGGESTGWPAVDKIITIKQGMLYVVTGVPGSGKSSWIDAMLVNLAKASGWRSVMASFENPIPIHIAKLCSAYLGKAFGDKHSNRMSKDESVTAQEWVNDHFMFMSNDIEMPTVQSILDRARVGLLRMGAKVVVMDPANFLQYKDGDDDHNTQVDDALVQFKNFAMANDIAFFLVAHPRKPGNSNGGDWYPMGYSIAGTAGFYNRCDVGMTIHRTEEDFTRAIVWKARFNHIASNGEAYLSYDTATGQFTEATVRPQKASNDYWNDF